MSESEQISLKGPAKAFRNSFGEQVFDLACHAAVPVVLSSDLLHLLRINFFLDQPESLPYVAESQILLSPLCNEVGSDLYEISPEIRDSLLSELAANPAYGETRIREIASLLFEYSERFLPWRDNLAIERAQQLTALNFLDPERAKNWLESAEQQPLLKTANDRKWFIAMRSELRKLDAVLSSSKAREVAEIEASSEGGDISPFGLKLLHSFKAHDKPIGRFAWSRDGSQLATPSADKTVKIWDTRTGQLIQTLSGHTERVICVDWSPQGKTLASGSDDQTARIWDTTSGSLIESISNRSSSVASVAWSPDGNTLALGFNDSTVLLWQNGRVIETRRGWGMVTSLKWSPDGTQLAAASEDETVVQVWNSKTPRLARTLKHKAQVLALDWSSNGKLIATGCGDNTVWLWEAVNDNPPKILEGHTKIVNAVSFSSDGRIVSSKSRDGTVRLWRTDSGEPVSVLPNQGWHFVVAGIAFHPHQPQLATLAEQDTVINIWQVDLAALLTRTIEFAETGFATTKIILLGAPGVGKTAIANALRSHRHRTVSPFDRINLADLLTSHMPGGVRRETFVWDLDLPDQLLTRIDLYETDIVLLLFDAQSAPTSLAQMQRYWNEVTHGAERGVRSVWIGVSRGLDRDKELTLERKSRIGNQLRDYWFVNVADGTQADELVERLKLEISNLILRREVQIGNFYIVEDYIRRLMEQGSTYSGFDTLLRSLNKDRKFTENKDHKFSERQLRRCLWHLDRSGKIRLLRSSRDEEIAWLQPAYVNRLLAIIIDGARTNWRGPGRIQERRLADLVREYKYFEELDAQAKETLLDCTVNLLVDRQLCTRVGGELVFLDLIPRREQQSETPSKEQSAFDQLLSWLAPDREMAARKYEDIRRGLIRIFRAQDMSDSEGLADETFDRIIKKLPEITPIYIGDPARYFHGVARNIIREFARRRLSLPIEPLSESQIYEPPDTNLESEHDCLDKCLNNLSTENREFVLAYYADTKQKRIDSRNQLAESLGISRNTVQVRAYRIRSKLHECIRNCLDEKGRAF